MMAALRGGDGVRWWEDVARRRRGRLLSGGAGGVRAIPILVLRALRRILNDTNIMLQLLGGPEYGGWTVETAGLGKNSIVYSFGIGHDASWDLAMMKTFRCGVEAFDPTPDPIAWVSKQNFPSKFHFHPYGIAHLTARRHSIY